MLSIEQRHKYIMDQMNKKGFIRVQEVADALGVTGATIRKDLRILESRHVLHRNHGSASPVKQKVIDLPIHEKSSIRAGEKKRIAQVAARLVVEDDSVILTSGTTIEALALALKPKGTLNAVTPSIRVGVLLSEKENVEVMMLGGRIIKKSFSVRDTYTMEGLKNVSCSKLFFSCDGFDLDAGIMCATEDEARMTSSMIDAVPEAILLADSSKLGKLGFGKICPIERVHTMVTDKGLSDEARQRFEEAGVRVLLA